MKTRRISFSSHAVADAPFSCAYELEDHGYTGWEMVEDGADGLNSESLKNVQDICETTDLELTLHLPFSDMNLASLNTGIHREVLRQMKDYLELASDFVELAVVHPGYLSPYGARVPERAWQATIGSLQVICDFAADYGVLVTVENMPDVPKVFGKYPQEMLRLLDLVDRPNIGLTFDVGHANTMGLVDEFLKVYQGRISHVHLHDNMGKKDEHLPVGKGNIDWKAVMDGLSHYSGIFVTEVDCLEDGVESLAFLRAL